MVHCFASPSRIKIQWMIEALLPKYSDRIAQDSHLIPYYPSNYNRFEALENYVKA